MKYAANHKALFDYTILEHFEAGVELRGHEVKSIRSGHAKLEGSYVKIIGGEAFLVNAQIFPYALSRPDLADPLRTRKLLFHKRELIRLQSKLDGAGLTLVALSWYTKGPRIKLDVGLARGKKQYEKREIIKKRDEVRDLEKQFRGKVK
ncbi:MAG: SsrA-binding protein SmpB [Patescibacteria group bacterium]